MRLGQVNGNTGAPILVFECPTQRRPSLGEFWNESEAFFGMTGVAMEGYGGFVLPNNSRRFQRRKASFLPIALSLRPDCRTTLTQFPRCSPVYKVFSFHFRGSMQAWEAPWKSPTNLIRSALDRFRELMLYSLRRHSLDPMLAHP